MRRRSKKELAEDCIQSPLGQLVVIFCGEKLCLLEFADSEKLPQKKRKIENHFSIKSIPKRTLFHQQLEEELEGYFCRKRTSFSVEMYLIGTEFQQKVWAILAEIPYGETLSYKQQALRLGNERALRAVASANGKNPISILIPCHRVVGSDGSLVGYASGIERKKSLLNLERESVDIKNK